MKYHTGLDLVNYGVVVETIASGYLDSDNRYDPHVGLLNAMRVFWNNCVFESELDDKYPHNIVNIMDMKEIAENEDFIEAFNESLIVDMVRFDFANAYADAMKMVENRQRESEMSDLARATSDLAKVLPEMLNTVKPFVNAMASGNSILASGNNILESGKALQDMNFVPNMPGTLTPEGATPSVKNLAQALQLLAPLINDGNFDTSSLESVIPNIKNIAQMYKSLAPLTGEGNSDTLPQDSDALADFIGQVTDGNTN